MSCHMNKPSHLKLVVSHGVAVEDSNADEAARKRARDYLVARIVPRLIPQLPEVHPRQSQEPRRPLSAFIAESLLVTTIASVRIALSLMDDGAARIEDKRRAKAPNVPANSPDAVSSAIQKTRSMIHTGQTIIDFLEDPRI